MFGTAALRDRVLAAWAAAPSRFREDANAEEELIHGAYRDRVIIELAQNAADAAARSGVEGRLSLSLEGTTLIAANTGVPLDAAGVEALSTLRASAKRDDEDSVGRFGVGFAAVLAVSDSPSVLSRTGGVRWSRTEVIDEIRNIPQLTAELERRGESVPVLRLPFDAAGDVPAGYDTAVLLPLRDRTAVDEVRQMVDAVDDALLLTLPALREIAVDVDGDRHVLAASEPVAVDELGRISERVIGDRRWRLATSTARLTPSILAERPTEERTRLDRFAAVAVPVTHGAPAALPRSIPAVLHAPTPTDDRTALPVLVIADLPLDSSRRRVASGQVCDHVIDTVADAYGSIVASFDHPDALRLVPGPMGAGEVDAALHRAVANVLTDTPFVPRGGVRDGEIRIRPRDVVLLRGLDPDDDSLLARIVSGLPRRGWSRTDPLRRLGARELSVADLVDELATLRLEPAEWPEVYESLSAADPSDLASLPVPLADGRVVRGARGLLIAGEVGADPLQLLGLRVVDPRAEHPLVRRLGAVAATPASVLDDPRTRDAVEAELDTGGDRLDDLADAVLALVAASGQTYERHPWLGSLEFPDASGDFAPAHELVLPGSPVLDLLQDPAEFAIADHAVERHGIDVLRAVGVRSGLSVLRRADLVMDEVADLDLDDADGWRVAVQRRLPQSDVPQIVPEFAAVRDLEAIRDDAWADALVLMASDPTVRHAVTSPVHVVGADGTRTAVPSYTSWWLGAYARVDGLRMRDQATADADRAVRNLLPPLPAALDEDFAAAVGGARELGDVESGTLLGRLADRDVDLDAAALADVYAELVSREVSVPWASTHVRVPDGLTTRVVAAAVVVVVDAPYWLQLITGPVIVGQAGLAELLGVAAAGDSYVVQVESTGTTAPVPAPIRSIAPDAPSRYVEHDDLRVGGASVAWWVDEGRIHAATLEGLAYGLAWTAGRWQYRWQIAAVLSDPESLESVLLADQFPP